MYLSSINLTDYRNYRRLEWSLCPGINILTGANAQGKTNLIEAIYYLSIGKAYRQARDEELIRWGAGAFAIKGEVEGRAGNAALEICFKPGEKQGKTVAVNGFKTRRWEEASGVFTSVLFSPESMSIIKGSPAERRGFIDRDLCQISPAYAADLFKFKRILSQRNALLKRLALSRTTRSEARESLSIWDSQFIHYSSRIIEKRMAFIEKMAPLARLTHRRLTRGGENLEIRYATRDNEGESGGVITEAPGQGKQWDYAGIAAFLQTRSELTLEEDLRFKSTRWGPHRDDLKVSLDGRDTRTYGSQGQQRTSALALKLAEIELFRGESGQYPVLLLDDVLSELDGDRQRQLLSVINEKNIQSVVTATELGDVKMSANKPVKRFTVSAGELREY